MRFISFKTECPHCHVDGDIVVVAATLVKTGVRLSMHSKLYEDGFEVPDSDPDSKDSSTEDEVCRCLKCNREIELSELTLWRD